MTTTETMPMQSLAPAHRLTAGVTICILALLVGGCDSPARADGEVTHVPADAVAAVGAEPLLTVGSLDGPEHEQFSRILTAFLHAGRLIVAEETVQRVEVFDQEGAYIETLGGSGGGPGEFASLHSLLPFGRDRLVAWDSRQSRGTVLDLDDHAPRTFDFSGTEALGPPHALIEGVFDDDLLVMQGPPTEVEDEGARWRMLEFFRVSVGDGAEPGAAESIGTFAKRLCGEVRDGGLSCRNVRFGPEGRWAGGAHGFAHTRGDLPQITVVSTDGTRSTVRLDLEPEPVTRADLAQAGDRASRETTDASHHPIFDRLKWDGRGRVWARVTGSNDWVVTDPAGQRAKRVAVPRGLVVHQITADRLVGVWRDDLNVPYVLVYELLI